MYRLTEYRMDVFLRCGNDARAVFKLCVGEISINDKAVCL